MSTRCWRAFFPPRDLTRILSRAFWRQSREALATARVLRWTELRAGLHLLSEMFIRGGVVTTIHSQLAGNQVVARLIMQPDADILLKINVDGPMDGLLPMQLQAAVLALTAQLHGAKTRIESIRRLALLAVVLAMSGFATLGMTAIHSILWQAVLLISLGFVALVARWMVGLAIHWALRRVVQ